MQATVTILRGEMVLLTGTVLMVRMRENLGKGETVVRNLQLEILEAEDHREVGQGMEMMMEMTMGTMNLMMKMKIVISSSE